MTPPLALLLLVLAPSTAGARSWWSIEVPALGTVRGDDPLHGPGSVLLTEDASFLYGPSSASFGPDAALGGDDGGAFRPPPGPPQQGQQWHAGEGGSGAGAKADPFVTYSTPTPAPLLVHGADAKGSEEPAVGSRPYEQQPSSQAQAQVATSFPSGSPVASRPEPSTSAPTTPEPTRGPTPQPTTPAPVEMVRPLPVPSAPPTTGSPSASPVYQPTFTPSRTYEAYNGSCPPGHDLFRLWLYDSAGDGWGSTKLVVRESTSTSLEDAAFVGTLDAERGVVRHDPGSSMSRYHDKKKKKWNDGRRRALEGRHRRLEEAVGHSKASGGSMARGFASGFASGFDRTAPAPDGASGSSASAFASAGSSSSASAFAFAGSSFGSGSSGGEGEPVQGAARDEARRGGPPAPSSGAGTVRAQEPAPTAPGPDAPYAESVYICLKRNACYESSVSGGTFLEETRWEVTRVELGSGDNVGLVAKGVGGGTGACRFSLDGTCQLTCDGEFVLRVL